MFGFVFLSFLLLGTSHQVCSLYSEDDYTRTNFQGLPFNKHPLETIRSTLHLMHFKYPHVLERDCFLNTCKYERALAIVKDNRKATVYWSLLNCDKYGITCPVHGKWSSWESWSQCQNVCGPEQRIRFRTCSNPHPQYNGRECKGKVSEIGDCGVRQDGLECLIDPHLHIGSWSLWSSWSPCKATCGRSTKTQHRECRPTVKPYLDKCVGKSMRSLSCLVGRCPTSGNWAKWGPWHDCSTKHTCGTGYQHRIRQCNKPYPVGKDKDCVGPSSQLKGCKGPPCEVQPPATAHFVGNSFVRYRYMDPTNFLNVYVKFMPTSMSGTIFQYSSLDAEFLYSLVSSNEDIQEDFMYAYLTSRDNIRIKVSINASTELDMLVGFAKIGSWNDIKVSIVSDTITARLNSGENVIGKLWEYPQTPVEDKDEALISAMSVDFGSLEKALGFNISLGNLALGNFSQTSEDLIGAVSEVTDTLTESFKLQERKIFAQFDGQIVLGKVRADQPSFRGSISHVAVNFQKHSLMAKQDGYPIKYTPIGSDFVEYSENQKQDLDASLPYFHGSQVVKVPLASAWWHNGAGEGLGVVAYFEVVFKPETADGVLLHTQGTYNKACFMKLFLYNTTNIKLMLSISGAVHSLHVEDAIFPGNWNIVEFQLVKNMMLRFNVNGHRREMKMPSLKQFDDLGNIVYVGGGKHKSSLEQELTFKNAAIASHLHWYQGYIFRVVLNQMSFYLQTAAHTNSFGMPMSHLLATPNSWNQYTFEKIEEKPDPTKNETIVNAHKLKCHIPKLPDKELRYSMLWFHDDLPVIPSSRLWTAEDKSGNLLSTNLHIRIQDRNPADLSGVYQCVLKRNERDMILATYIVAMLYDEQTLAEATSIWSTVRHISYFAGVNILPFIIMGSVIVTLIIILIIVAIVKSCRKRRLAATCNVTKDEVASLIDTPKKKKHGKGKHTEKSAKDDEKVALLADDDHDDVIIDEEEAISKKHRKNKKHHHHRKHHRH